MVPGVLSLLLPEWQGCGTDASVAAGARALVGRLSSHTFVTIEAPAEESLVTEGGVVGVASIAPRARQTLDLIRERQPSRIFTIGGTCGVELAPVAYLNERYRGDLAVVWLDAHADLNTPATSPSAHFHGMVLRTLMGEGPASLVDLIPRKLSPEQIVLAGARDLDRDEATFVSDAPIAWLRPADFLVPDRVAGRVRARGFKKIYLHLDLDVIDPLEFPDVLVPAPSGVSMNTLAETIQNLAASFDVVGFSVVEFRPRSSDAVIQLAKWIDRLARPFGR
jgi:arginase